MNLIENFHNLSFQHSKEILNKIHVIHLYVLLTHFTN